MLLGSAFRRGLCRRAVAVAVAVVGAGASACAGAMGLGAALGASPSGRALAVTRSAQDNVQAEVGLALAADVQRSMVVQRGEPFTASGRAAPGARVSAVFDGELATAACDGAGEWSVTFRPRREASEGHVLAVEAGRQRIVVEDVAVGDVWVFFGGEELCEASLGPRRQRPAGLPSRVRLLTLPAPAPLGDVVWSAEERARVAVARLRGHWRSASELEGAALPAIPLRFAAALSAAVDVPLGIVVVSSGPAPLVSWAPRAGLAPEPPFQGRLQAWWRSSAVAGDLRSAASRHLAGALDIQPSLPDLGVHPYQPGYLWQAALQPALQRPFAGAVLACSGLAPELPAHHARLLAVLAAALPPGPSGARPLLLLESAESDVFADPAGLASAARRDIERRVAAAPGRGLAVQYDLRQRAGADRGAAGERLARLALARVYGRLGAGLVGPEPLRARWDPTDRAVRVEFVEAEELAAEAAIEGFDALDAAGAARPVVARLTRQGVALAIEGERPSAVRYGFSTAWRANLRDREGNPCPTFELPVE